MTLTNLYTAGSQLLFNAVQSNWKFSRRKTTCGTTVTFCGYRLTATKDDEVLINPVDSNISALLDFQSPTTKKQLQSLLGVANTLSKWIPFLADLTPGLRQLAKSRCHFRWKQDHEHELTNLRTQAQNLIPLRAFTPGRPTYLYADA